MPESHSWPAGGPDVPPPVAALLTPRGRGAVATIEFRGPAELLDGHEPQLPVFRAANGRPVVAQPVNRIVFGRWGTAVPEDVVLCRTQTDIAEIHCHGGEAAIGRILQDLAGCGCRIASWPEIVHATCHAVEAECVQALVQATTWRTAVILLEQSSGLLQRAFDTLAHGPPEVAERQRRELLQWAEFGIHLTRPWKVVLCGRPNVGKSSLINALSGFARSIVYDQPGTTRDVITVETAFEGWPVELSDTAGLRDVQDALESAGIARARERLAAADLPVVVLDTSRPPVADDLRLLADWPAAIIVGNKADLPDAWISGFPAGALRVSSVTGAGLNDLMRRIVERLVPEIPAANTPIPVSLRQMRILREWHSD